MERATKSAPPPERSFEALIPSRMGEVQNQPTTEDLLSRSAEWLSEIKAGTEQLTKDTPQPESGISVAAKVLATAFSDKPGPGEAKEAFIQRRSTERPSTYAPKKFNHKEASSSPSLGYGDLSQKDIEAIAIQEAKLRSMDPDTAVAIFRSEGAGSYQSRVKREGKGSYNGYEDSYGPYQLYRGGGLGNEYEEATGRDLRTDNTPEGITNQIRFALDKAVVLGWTPWYGRKTAGVGEREGLAGARAIGNWK